MRNRKENSNHWHKIPNWLAGIWKAEFSVTKDTTGQNQTYKRLGEVLFGFQQDSNGQVWEMDNAPYWTTFDAGTCYSTTLILSNELVSYSNNSISCKGLLIVFDIDKQTGKIISCHQAEGLHTYTLISAGVLRYTIAKRSFNSDGNSVSTTENYSQMTKSQPFTNLDVSESTGENYKQLFYDFIHR